MFYIRKKNKKTQKQKNRKTNLHPKDFAACLAVEFITTSTGGLQQGSF